MRAYNLNSLFPYSVGFDRFDRLFDQATGTRDVSYPPYNILKTGQDNYRITMAVAGFTEDDIELVAQENVLTVRGRLQEPKDDQQVVYLHRGIGARAFEHTFQLADYVVVKSASLNNGLLDIELVREVPEAMKPRKIEIAHGQGQKVIEGKAGEQKAA